MRRPLTLCFILPILVILTGCGEDVRYFKKIQLNGAFEYVGLYPISKLQATKEQGYKLTYYDDKLEIVEFLSKGRLSMCGEGFARHVYKRLPKMILISSENQHGFRILQNDTYTYQSLQLDSIGVPIISAFLDRNFHPRENEGVLLTRLISDERGRLKQSMYFDRNGKPVRDATGVYGVQRKFDERDYIIEARYIDSDLRLTTDVNNTAIVTYAYDDAGNMIEMNLLDKERRPVNGTDGIATRRWRFDSYGNKIEASSYDRFGNLVNNKQGVAFSVLKYDVAGNVIALEYFDSTRRPADPAKINLFYNDDGLCTKQVSFRRSPDNDSMYIDFSIRLFYNANRNLVEQRRYNARNELFEENGIAIFRFGYDGAHNRISYQGFDASDEAATFDKRISRIVWKYDEWGQMIETRYYDVDADLAGDHYHVAITRFQYDGCGNIIEESFFDSLENATEFDGVSVRKFRYDGMEFFNGEEKFDRQGNQIKPAIETKSL